jgi:predicted DNA-binding transcriptional regulator AlpA
MPTKPRATNARVRDIRASMPHAPDDERLLSKLEVVDRVGKSFVTIWQWMQDGKFPRARDAHGRPVWLASEIDAWMKQLPIRRFKGDR